MTNEKDESRARYFKAVNLLLSDYRGPIRCPLNEDDDLQITAHQFQRESGEKKVEYELYCPSCRFREYVLTSAGNGPYVWQD